MSDPAFQSPDGLSGPGDPGALSGVMFADISGSTRLYEQVGDSAAAAVVSQGIALLRQKSEAAGGRVMRVVGDEILAVFASADAAASAAVAMQVGIDQLAPTAGIKVGVRIGFNFGRVMERDGELYGDAVNVAARLAGLAQKDQIITSLETYQALAPERKTSCRRLYAVQVKGKEKEVELWQVIWRQSEDLTSVVSDPAPAERANAALRLRYRGKELVLNSARAFVSLGRDLSAGLVIVDAKVSRAHGKIERRMHKFILFDHSANGTYVTIDGDKEVLLRREELPLHGRGWITFGLPRSQTSEVVEFFCEG